jgi:hypothetical protein
MSHAAALAGCADIKKPTEGAVGKDHFKKSGEREKLQDRL